MQLSIALSPDKLSIINNLQTVTEPAKAWMPHVTERISPCFDKLNRHDTYDLGVYFGLSIG